MLTAKAKYGIKAMIYLAGSYRGNWAQAGEIADTQQIPRQFLGNILSELRMAGLVHSKKGKGGGYFLSRPPAQISIGEIIRVLDGPLMPMACASRLDYRPCSDCEEEAHCRVRAVMLQVRETTARVLDNTSLLLMMPPGDGPIVLNRRVSGQALPA